MSGLSDHSNGLDEILSQFLHSRTGEIRVHRRSLLLHHHSLLYTGISQRESRSRQ